MRKTVQCLTNLLRYLEYYERGVKVYPEKQVSEWFTSYESQLLFAGLRLGYLTKRNVRFIL